MIGLLQRSASLRTGAVLLLLAMLASRTAVAALDAAVEQGGELYRQYCETCHGADMVTVSKLVPDLRRFPRDAPERFRQSVMNGKGSGMPPWRDTLTAEDVAALWAYVRANAAE